MTEKATLQNLCDEIAKMVPSEHLKDTSTSQFSSFIENLKKKGISKKELNAIVRAYNYFNFLMLDVAGDDTPASGATDNQKSVKDAKMDTSASASASGSTSASTSTSDPSASSTEDEENSEMIQILLSIAENEPNEPNEPNKLTKPNEPNE